MTDKAASTYTAITPILTDRVMGIDDPAGTPEVVLIELSALMTLLQASYDVRYFGLQNVARTTSNFRKTSSTTLANITGLSFNVAAGGVYEFESQLYLSCNASGGAKVAISGTCTATSIVYVMFFSEATGGLSLGGALNEALNGSLGGTKAYTSVIVKGTIVVANAGTLTVQFAQNASYATASTVYAGSTFQCERIA